MTIYLPRARISVALAADQAQTANVWASIAWGTIIEQDGVPYTAGNTNILVPTGMTKMRGWLFVIWNGGVNTGTRECAIHRNTQGGAAFDSRAAPAQAQAGSDGGKSVVTPGWANVTAGDSIFGNAMTTITMNLRGSTTNGNRCHMQLEFSA